MMTLTQQVQLIAASILIVSVVVWAFWIVRNPKQWKYSVPPLTWTVHALVFYGFLFGRDLLHIFPPGYNMTPWSAVLRLHAAFLLLGIGLVMLLEKMIINRVNGQHR